MILSRAREVTRALIVCLMIFGAMAVSAVDAYEALPGRTFYTDEAVGHLVFVDLDESQDMAAPLTADVLLQGRLLVEGAPVIRGRQRSVAFPLASLPQGETEVTSRVFVEDRTLGQVSTRIRRLPPNPRAVKIDRLTGGLVVDGLPLLPVGFYCYSPVQPTLAEEEVVRGFNVMSPYQSNDPATRDERRAYMDRAAELGMKVHYQLLRVAGGGGVSLGTPADTSSVRREAWLREEVEAFRDHPALLAWYISDEPTGHGATPEQLQRSYDLVHELDPYHPITIVFVNPGKAIDFAGAMDLAMVDPYPIPNGAPGSVVGAVRTLVQDLSPRIPVWMVPQAFGGSEWWTREPIGPELRLMSWLGLIEGATGIQYFIRHGLSGFPKSPVTWSAASQVALEASALTTALLSTEAPPTVITEQNSGIRATAWRHEGQVIVVAANTENRPVPMQLELPDLTIQGDAEVLYEERSLAFDTGSGTPNPLDLLSVPLGLVTGILRRQPEAPEPTTAAITSGVVLEESMPPYGVRLYRLHEVGEAEDQLSVSPLNRTIDPSFEWDASASVPSALYASTGKGRGATYFVDDRVAYHGRRSIRLHTPRAGEGVILGPYSPRVDPLRSYRLSVWAKAAEGPEPPTLQLATSMGRTDSIRHELTTQWKRYSLDAMAVDGAAARAGLRLSLVTPGTAWLDLLEFYDISPHIVSNPSPDGELHVSMESFVRDAELRYAIDTEVTADSPLYTGLVKLGGSSEVRAGLFRDGQALSTATLALHNHSAVGRFVDLAQEPSPRYPGHGARTLTDAVLGGAQFNDPRWLGFEGTDVVAVVDLGETIAIDRVAARFFHNAASWIWLPRRLQVEVSADGERFASFGGTVHDVDDRASGSFAREMIVEGDPVIARYVRVYAEGIRQCPEWHPGAGGPAWVFMDEIRVNPEGM